MTNIDVIRIDKSIKNNEELFRFDIIFDDGSSHGSCFCYIDLQSCMEALNFTLRISGETQ